MLITVRETFESVKTRQKRFARVTAADRLVAIAEEISPDESRPRTPIASTVAALFSRHTEIGRRLSMSRNLSVRSVSVAAASARIDVLEPIAIITREACVTRPADSEDCGPAPKQLSRERRSEASGHPG